MEDYEKSNGLKKNNHRAIYSRTVRAGKRTYFFDVRTTKENQPFLTITESKKRYDKSGKHRYEKHKVFLYQEDFGIFEEGLTDVLNYISNLNEETYQEEKEVDGNVDSDIIEGLEAEAYSNIEFEDLAE
jgi:hypothetical protein